LRFHGTCPRLGHKEILKFLDRILKFLLLA
jgi:hypothetical protein